MTEIARGGALTTIIVVTLLTVSMQGLAAHNSYGAHVNIAEADEVDEDGNLQADLPRDHPYSQQFHENLDDPRPQPQDQWGDRYSDCEKASETSNYAPWENSEQCYIGFFDSQWQYLTYAGLAGFTTPRSNSDAFYAVNPAESEDDFEYCTGQEDPKDHTGPSVDDGGPADQAIANAERTQDDECQGNSHKQFTPTQGLIDQDLFEFPFQSKDTPGANQATDTPTASGTQTIPMMSRPYVFIFGQPHPDADPDPDHLDTDGERYTAGEGVFGDDPTAGGNPLVDIGGACGERTEQCKLLTPADIKAYDENEPDFVDEDKARVCGFAPQFSVLNPSALEISGCGVFGDHMNQFVGRTTYGGAGAVDAPTWVTTMPGWSRAVNYVAGSQWQVYFDEERTPVPIERPCQTDREHEDACGAYFNDEPEMDEGTYVIYAVNPKVPNLDHDLWCIRPNILGHGTDNQQIFDTYAADAVDFDLYTHFAREAVFEAVKATHGPVRDATSPVEPLLDVTSVAGLLSGGAEDTATNALQETVGSEAVDAFERADYTEDGATAHHNTPGNTQRDWTKVIDPAETEIACNSNAVVENVNTVTEHTGGLVINVDVDTQQGGIPIAPLGIPLANIPNQEIKDPTLVSEDGPAREDESRAGTWRPTVYDFGGRIVGALDDNGNGEFDACKSFTLQAQPSRDSCPWRSLWDAYNPQCTGTGADERTCGAILEDNGYDVAGNDTGEDSGVGLFWELKLTGPIALFDEELNRPGEIENRTRLVGDDAPTQTNCVVGISKGFEEHFPDRYDASTVQQAAVEECDVDGEVVVITDAFNDQGGAGGGFSSAVDFAKAMPTPDGLRLLEDGFAEGDEICIHGSWAVQDEIAGSTTDTAGNVDLHGDADPWNFSDCDNLTSGQR